MWWKLSALLLVTLVIAFAVIPMRTHAVAYDPDANQSGWSLSSMVGAMFLTPGTVAVLAIILAGSGFVAFQIIRGNW